MAKVRRARRPCRTSAIPSGAEQIVGLARLLRANAHAAVENIALWHERDISHSSVERVILPDSFLALDHMLRRFARIVSGMVVYPDRMLENLGRSRGVIFSGQVLLELARGGVTREQAYEWVQRNAMRAFHEPQDFKTLLVADPEVMRVLSPAQIEKAFDLNEQLRNVDAVFDRVLTPSSLECRLREPGESMLTGTKRGRSSGWPQLNRREGEECGHGST